MFPISYHWITFDIFIIDSLLVLNMLKTKNTKHIAADSCNGFDTSIFTVIIVKNRSRGVLKICCEFSGELPCWSVIPIKLQSNFIETTLRHGCSPVNLLHTFRTTFPKNTSGRLLLKELLYQFHFQLNCLCSRNFSFSRDLTSADE